VVLPHYAEGTSYEDYENAVKELAEMIGIRTGLEIKPVLTAGQPAAGQAAIIEIDHSEYNGLETLINDTGLTPTQAWDIYFQ